MSKPDTSAHLEHVPDDTAYPANAPNNKPNNGFSKAQQAGQHAGGHGARLVRDDAVSVTGPEWVHSRVQSLDLLLTGLAMQDAYAKRDADELQALTDHVPANEAVACLLLAMEVMSGICAAQMQMAPPTITSSIRRRVIREIAGSATSDGGERGQPE